MAEPWEEQVVSALVTALGEISKASGFFHTPKIKRSHEIGPWLLREDDPEIIALAPFEIELTEQAGQQYEETLILDFMLGKRHTESDVAFEEELPLRETRQYELWEDFRKKIMEDVTLDGLVSNVNFRKVILGPSEILYIPGWAVVIGQIAPNHSLVNGIP